MRKLLSFFIVGVLAAVAYNKYRERSYVAEIQRLADTEDSRTETSSTEVERDDASNFTCDGRTRCSQMHSCEEATWFIQHCPGTEMDGDGDGVPCERQWCARQ